MECTKVPCPCTDGKLLSLTVISNATQTNVTGAKNWATVKMATDEVLVEATTIPNTEACWQAIKWSGDSGSPGDKPNQRKLSRAASKKLHIDAELGGGKDSLDVWVLWATVTINASGTTPANSVQFGGIEDGTENLGAVTWNGKTYGAGKVGPVAEISPKGVHDIVKSGWDFKRDRMSHDWKDGGKNTAANYWNTTWQDDTSLARWKKLAPDGDDKIYDLDGPNIFAAGITDYETYNNFRQWIEWNGDRCADNVEWYYQARWQKSATPQVSLNEVGTGNITLPAKSHFHP
jgi:hypothetical protein